MTRSSHRASFMGGHWQRSRRRGGPGALLARLRIAFPFLGMMCLASGAALPQGIDCAGLRAQIAALDQANARDNPYLVQAQQQREDLRRSMSYAHQMGCDRQQFFFFGSAPPAQCPGLNAQIQQIQASVGQLEANARANTSPERQQLAARFYAYCRSADAAPHQSGFFESLFGGQSAPNAQPPQDPLEQAPAAGDETPQGGSEVLCVRHCDGYFFPLNYSERSGSETLSDFCKASCPNAGASVYTRVPGEVIQTAVGLDGKAYTDLPAALKYQKSLDPACTCRAAGASWSDTLADAESILNNGGRRDVMVTPEKSAEMARPQSAARTAKAAPAKPDDLEQTDAAAAAQVPTAGTDSAGIATGDVKNGTAYSQGQGQTVEITGPDGVKRRVRIVGPQL